MSGGARRLAAAAIAIDYEVLEPVTDRTAVPPPPTKELVDRLLAVGPKYGIKFVLPE